MGIQYTEVLIQVSNVDLNFYVTDTDCFMQECTLSDIYLSDPSTVLSASCNANLFRNKNVTYIKLLFSPKWKNISSKKKKKLVFFFKF